MRRIKKSTLLLTIQFYVTAIAFFGFSLVQSKEYVIGVEDISYYPLYDFSADNLERPSFTKELLSTFFRHQGYKFSFVALPLKRFDKWYVEEAIDFKFPDNPRWRSQESKKLNLFYSEPVLQLIAGSYVLNKNKDMPRKDVKRLGTILGFASTLWYDRLDNNTLELTEASSSFSLVKHLLTGNVDVVNIDKNVINYNLKLLKHDASAVVLNPHIIHQHFSYYFSTILHPEIITEFNQFLIEQNQLVSALKLKYAIIESPE